MRNDEQKTQGGMPRSRRNNGIMPTSFRTVTGYLRIVSSGASTVASTVKSAGASFASSIVDRDADASRDQVHWAGFDKLEYEGGVIRQVLLLAYQSGFQVWDVHEADNVCELVSRYDGPVSFLQMQPMPVSSKRSGDNFADVRPLLVIVGDGSLSGGCSTEHELAAPNRNINACHDSGDGNSLPTVVWFYSMRSRSYVHHLKFRSTVYCVRCSSWVVAISQGAQIHCFDAATLKREYTILTNPIITGPLTPGNIGYGPLAVGSRWLAYSGSPVTVSNTGRVSPQHLTPSASFSGSALHGSLVAHYAKESSKQLAAGIVTLGDLGYKLSRYCSERLSECNNSLKLGSAAWQSNGTVNGHLQDADNVGMVIVRDLVLKSVISQFRAHSSPISALCFDPSGTLLVTASVQGHNINVFRIMPVHYGNPSESDADGSYVHLYRLQRGFTNAVIQDISFSDDSHWIMVSSSRGTSHLFAISPYGGCVNIQPMDASLTSKNNGLCVMTRPAVHGPPFSGPTVLNQQRICASGPPVTLSVVSRIKNGNNGWKGTVTGAAAAATGRISSLSGTIASSFHNCKGSDLHADTSLLRTNCHLLVFSPSGCVMQYVLRFCTEPDSGMVPGRGTPYQSAPDCDARLVVEAVQKWDICQRKNRREQEDNVDVYGEHADSCTIFPDVNKGGNIVSHLEKVLVLKAKINPEERHHMYISEAELHMHQTRIPLWARSEIYCQLMIFEGMKMAEENSWGGEFEVEKIPTRTIEARSKDLVPLFDFRQTHISEQSRTPGFDSSPQLLCQSSGFSEDGRFSCRSNCCSLDCLSDGGTALTEENGLQGPQASTALTQGIVNNSYRPRTNSLLETVNNEEKLKRATDIMLVNNSESLMMEN